LYPLWLCLDALLHKDIFMENELMLCGTVNWAAYYLTPPWATQKSYGYNKYCNKMKSYISKNSHFMKEL